MTTIKKLFNKLLPERVGSKKTEAAGQKKGKQLKGKGQQPDKEDAASLSPYEAKRKAVADAFAARRPDEAQIACSIRYAHGTTSALLPLLSRTDFSLIPTGQLLSEGIAPMGGELFQGGLRATGVNQNRISMSQVKDGGIVYGRKYAGSPPTAEKFCGLQKGYIEEFGRLALGDHFPMQHAQYAGLSGLRLSQLGSLDAQSRNTLQKCAERISTYMQSPSWAALEVLENVVNERTYQMPPATPEHPWDTAQRAEGEYRFWGASQGSERHDAGRFQTHLSVLSKNEFSLLKDTLDIKEKRPELYASAHTVTRKLVNSYMAMTRRANALLNCLDDPQYKMTELDQGMSFHEGFGLVLASTRPLPGGNPGGDGFDEVSFAGPLRLGHEIDVILADETHTARVQRFLSEHHLSDSVKVLNYDDYDSALGRK